MTKTRIDSMRELVSITAEFLISLVVLVGGGVLLYTGSNTEIASAAISTVLVYWFTSRQNDKHVKQLETQQQVLTPTEKPTEEKPS